VSRPLTLWPAAVPQLYPIEPARPPAAAACAFPCECSRS
jgi:hypothetical protein